MLLLGNNDIHQETREGGRKGREKERDREPILTTVLTPTKVNLIKHNYVKAVSSVCSLTLKTLIVS